MIRFFTTPALIVAAALTLSACASPSQVSRNAPFENQVPSIEVPMQDWSIEGVQVIVPRSLSVSEANSIKPNADIVWRGDPMGDRYLQIEQLMHSALVPVLRPREGAQIPALVTLEITRFHALTERARYTIGGEHEIEFILTVRHAETGALLSGPRPVDLTFRAEGGRQAVEAEARGITQRVSVTHRLQSWALTEFASARSDLISVARAQN
jgi:hypothetical protein